jgi:serine protease
VSGVAALLYAKGAKNAEQVEKALFDGAAPVGKQDWSEEYGHGLLNARASLEALLNARTTTNWAPFLVSAALLVVVLLTIGSRQRPGYLNILLSPSFLIPLLLATVGVFFARWAFGRMTGSGSGVVDALSLPIPDWQRIIFGRGKVASPLFYSALIPLFASLIAVAARNIRPVVAGLALGFAGFLGYAAWAKAPALSWLPFHFLALPWLIVNAAVCLVLARAMLRKDAR